MMISDTFMTRSFKALAEKRKKRGRIYFKQVNRMFLDFKVKEISHAKEGTSTGTELSENLESGEAKDAK